MRKRLISQVDSELAWRELDAERGAEEADHLVAEELRMLDRPPMLGGPPRDD